MATIEAVDVVVDELTDILESDWRDLQNEGSKVPSKAIPGKEYKVILAERIAEDYVHRHYRSVVKSPDKRFFCFYYALPLRPDYDDSYGPQGEDGTGEVEFGEVERVIVRQVAYKPIKVAKSK